LDRVFGVAGGLVLGIFFAMVVVNFSAAPISVDWQLPALAAVVSLGASAAACLLPAISAARMEPAAALRQ